MVQTVASTGEFGLIARLAGRVPEGDGVIVGIGDDTAVLRPTGDHLLLATTDGQVEGVHFLRDATSASQVGHRALASNLSDIAAMGGRPRWALVSLTLPGDLEADWVDSFYDGLGALARRHQVGIVGGNVARSPGPIVVDLTVLGEVPSDRRLTRSGARPGDAVFVSGSPGASAGGLALILRPEIRERLSVDVADWLLRRHRLPEPRVDLGQRLAATAGVTAMIDVSDGVAGDLGHVLTASGVGATLEEAALPIAPEVRALVEAGGPAALDLFLGGGEDYELLFTCAPDKATGVTEASRIGTIEAESGLRLHRNDGRIVALDPRGHDHFDGRSR